MIMSICSPYVQIWSLDRTQDLLYSASYLTVSHLGYHKISLSKTETLSANQHLYSLKEVHITVPRMLTSSVALRAELSLSNLLRLQT